MKKKVSEVIDTIMSIVDIENINIISYEEDKERVNIVCSYTGGSNLFDFEIDELDYYLNVIFESDSIMIVQGVIYDDSTNNEDISYACKEMYFNLKKILEKVNSEYEFGSISEIDYDILNSICEDIKESLWSIKELI